MSSEVGWEGARSPGQVGDSRERRWDGNIVEVVPIVLRCRSGSPGWVGE